MYRDLGGVSPSLIWISGRGVNGPGVELVLAIGRIVLVLSSPFRLAEEDGKGEGDMEEDNVQRPHPRNGKQQHEV